MGTDRVHYLIVCNIDQEEHVLLWYSDDRDGVVTDEKGRIVSFGSVEGALAFANASGLLVTFERPSAYDLDELKGWLDDCKQPIDCRALLDCWNLFTDVAACAGRADAFRRSDRAAYSAYEKLFFGNNIPAATPPGASYEPVWSDGERVLLAGVMAAGLELLKSTLVRAD